MTTVALLAPLAALFVLVASVVAMVVAGLGSSSAIQRWLSPRSTTLHAAVIFAPVLAGLLACAAVASPNPFAGCHCATDVAGHCHICTEHPAFAMQLVMPALWLLGGWLVVVAPRMARLGRELLASRRWGRALRGAVDVHVDDIPVKLVDCGSPVAFTTGLVAPAIVFDRALWELLDDGERRAVVHHEHAHVARRDVLTLALLRLSGAVSLLPLGGRFVAGWKRVAEMRCDQHAARRVGDPTRVASALIAVERARAAGCAEASPQLVPVLGVAAGVELEARVLALLSEAEPTPSRALRSDAVGIGLALVALGTVVVLWPGDAFHHAVETVIDWLSHPH